MSRPEWLIQAAFSVGEDNWQLGALVEAADIVIALAADQVDPIGHGGVCCLCEEQWDPPESTWEHADSCPWKRSRLWMEQHSQ